MILSRVGLALVGAVLFLSAPAHATTFNWSYSDGGALNVGSGTFDATEQGLPGSGSFIVDAITGTANGQAITGLTSYAGDDQRIYLTPPFVNNLDSGGVAFTVTGGQAYNLYFWLSAGLGRVGYDCGVTGVCLIGPGTPGTTGLIAPDPSVPVDFSLTQVTSPIPAALPLFATGLGLMGLLARRRKKQAAA